MQLVEEATAGCWIGHRARMFTSEIGSVYSPPKQDRQALVVSSLPRQVETVIDFAHNERVRSLNSFNLPSRSPTPLVPTVGPLKSELLN